ncbi:hypothetical protein Dimus_030585, partial [Dionaea muscipula]
ADTSSSRSSRRRRRTSSHQQPPAARPPPLPWIFSRGSNQAARYHQLHATAGTRGVLLFLERAPVITRS